MNNESCQFDLFNDIAINEMPVPLDEIDVIPLNKVITNPPSTVTTIPEPILELEPRPAYDPLTCRSVIGPTASPIQDILMDFYDLCDYERELNALFSKEPSANSFHNTNNRKSTQMLDPFSNLDSYTPPTERKRLLSVSSNSSMANDLSMQLFPDFLNTIDHSSENGYRYIYSESTTNSENTVSTLCTQPSPKNDNSEFMDLEDRVSNATISTNSTAATDSSRSSASPSLQSYQKNMFDDHCYFKTNTKRMKTNSGNSSSNSADNTCTKPKISFENTNISLSSKDETRNSINQNKLSSDVSLDNLDDESISLILNYEEELCATSDLLPMYNELQEINLFNSTSSVSGPSPTQVSDTKPKKSPRTKKPMTSPIKKAKKTKSSNSKKKNSRNNNVRLLGANNIKTEIIDTSYPMFSNSQRKSHSSDSSSSSSNSNRKTYKKRTSTNRIRISVPNEMLENADSKRSIHNDLERQRRIDLKNLFEDLRKIVPVVSTNEKAPKKLILEKTKSYCEQLMERNDDLLNERERLQQSAKYLNDKLQMLLNMRSR